MFDRETYEKNVRDRCRAIGMTADPVCPACKKFPTEIEFTAGLAASAPPGAYLVNYEGDGSKAIYATCCGRHRIFYMPPTRIPTPYDLPGHPA